MKTGIKFWQRYEITLQVNLNIDTINKCVFLQTYLKKKRDKTFGVTLFLSCVASQLIHNKHRKIISSLKFELDSETD